MINCIYIHIPFCQKKCKYCSFCSFELLKLKGEYLNSLTKEINFYYKKNPISTLYFGGGTPGLLKAEEIFDLIKLFNFKKNREITLEINPDNADTEKLKKLKNIGINRISIGVQNFDNNILKILGRNHTREKIYECIEQIKTSGFDNFSIDLMYGLPTQTIKQWEQTLDEVIKLEIPHISLYGLKIEKGTYFYKFPPKELPDMDTQAKMYELAVKKLGKEYVHYEFSSFARNKKFISKHNSAYWKRKYYWGFGVSASGFIEDKRYTNTNNLKEYIVNPIQKCYTKLSKKEQLEEEIFLGLRLKDGIDFCKIEKKYCVDIKEKYKSLFEKYVKFGFLKYTKKGIKLTLKGVLVSNEILSDFIEI